MALGSAKDDFTVLFVHGAWHTPLFYQPTIQELHLRGYSALAPYLPTCDKTALAKDPDLDMIADAKVIEREITRLVIHEGKEVLLVTHSYGGVPGVEAVAEEFGRNYRAAHGNSGGVVGILGVSAFLIMPDTTLEDLNEGKPAPFVNVDDDGMTTTQNPGEHFFNDLDSATQAYYSSELVPQPRKAHSSKLTRAAYRYIPTGYVFCAQDRATPMFVQEGMVKNLQNAGVQITEYRIDSGHSPAISQPRQLVDIMIEFMSVARRGRGED